MPMLWREAKEIVAKYADRGALCFDNPKVDVFLRQVLQYMLISGAHGNIRRFDFCSVNGCITLPYELEVPLKLRIDGIVGNVWDRWYEFYNTNNLSDDQCVPCNTALNEDPNLYPIVYDLPQGGVRIATLGTCNEEEDAHIIVTGQDVSGREIFSTHKGKQISGEYISIRKGDLIQTVNYFAKVNTVLKTKTNGYTSLYWTNPTANTKGFLAEYAPSEEKPAYHRCKLTMRCPHIARVSIIGRIRLRSFYADTDYIPFDNIYLLDLAAQTVNANFNDNVQLSQAKGKMMEDVLNKENEFKRVNNGQPIEIAFPQSGGSIVNIIGGGRGWRW